MKKIISIVACAMFAFVAVTGMAMAQAKPAAPAAPAPAMAPAKAPAMAPAATDITGKIEKGKHGLILKAADGEYLLAGHDLSKMVGKKVVATGTVAEKAGQKTLTVTKVKVLK
jgi:hypothetical protein